MNHTYQITGMTCEGCQKSVQEALRSIPGVQSAAVDLGSSEAHITMVSHIPLKTFQEALSSKYSLSEKHIENRIEAVDKRVGPSKLEQLKPLFLIFAYLFTTSFLLNYSNWNLEEAMLDFMGLFFIVFSFFKLLDLKGFPESFKMYDPLARTVPAYALIYPFIELTLGILFLMRIQIYIALIVTLIILGITTYGVLKTLLSKKSIRCACLGTALNLPMTEATFIENAVMIAMASGMLIKMM